MAYFLLLVCAVAAVSALPAEDPVIRKLVPEGLRYMYADVEDGPPQLVDSWLKVSDLKSMARFDADAHNQYHLFTRDNPSLSQVLVNGRLDLVQESNFDPKKRVVVLIHGFMGSATAGSNVEMVPAFLKGEDLNVVVVDWSRGSHWGMNGINVARSAARFFNWLNSVTGASASQYHIAGFSVGGHAAGILARNMDGDVPYVTALDPASRWEIDEIVSPRDALFVEVIHTSAGVNGWGDPLGHVDFYPNGGRNMPGCLVSVICDHNRSYEYFAESVANGGFNHGVECRNRAEASIGSCTLSGKLSMGGLKPKTGASGIYFLRTNRGRPFSQG